MLPITLVEVCKMSHLNTNTAISKTRSLQTIYSGRTHFKQSKLRFIDWLKAVL